MTHQMLAEKIEHWPTGRLIPYARNPRKNDHAVEQMAGAIVLVKKSDRLLFVSFWFARQSVSGLFLLPASTVGASFG